MARSPTSSSRSSTSRDSYSSSSRRSSSHHHHSSSSKRSRDRDSLFTVRKHKKTKSSSNAMNVFDQAVLTVDEAPSAEIQDRLQRLNAWKQRSQAASQPEEPQPTLDERSTNETLAIDPLDLYMQSLMSESKEVAELQQPPEMEPERYFGAQEVYSEDDFEEKPEDSMSWMVQREKKFKKKEIKKTDHNKMNYIEFRKQFYVEPREISEMTDDQVAEYRKNELEGVQIRGKDCPRPIKRWTQCGLNATTLQLLQKYGYTAPFPIQAQAIPVIMSGRDCLACAKTGSGKTMAFVLPMVRHILDQPPISDTDGPVALILAPTRELAIQIHNEVRRFCKPVGLRSVCCYGGAAVSEQIAVLKRGAEIIVATPGRFIDMLCLNQGRVTNLKRCTYVVLDEADRMFDLGFEPQISAILVNVRPDRQTVMFSATFPKQIEGLAKKALKNPVEIVIGGRSVASNTVTQSVEVLEPTEKHRRLLQLLGEWYEKGSILIFVDRQESVDILFRDLTSSGYLCLSLHGGMDQADRDYTILDFKKKVRTILIATSVAARGLDVKELIVVINYNVPNHYEDYIHRIGRTGRAGNKGYSFTFITPDEERFAPDMVKALETANQPVPDNLKNLAVSFKEKVTKGEVQFSSNSGYSSAKGFKFDEKESQLKVQEKDRQKKSFGLAEDQEPEEEPASSSIVTEDAKEKLEAVAAASTAAPVVGGVEGQIASLKAALAAAKSKNASESDKKAAVAAAKAKAAALSLQMAMETLPSVQLLGDMGPEPDFFTDELEINDYPQQARWKVTARGSLNEMLEKLDVSVTTKGTFIPTGRTPGVGERKLHVVIEGKSKMDVHLAKKEIKRILEEAAIQAKPDEKEQYAKYTVV